MNIIEVKNLKKSYPGKLAVDNVSFSLQSNEILGVIGPNGAGKSTTIKTILDFLKPDSGEISVFGTKMNESLKNKIGYMPEEKGLYKKYKVTYLITYLAMLKGMDKGRALKRAEEFLLQTGMYEDRNKKIEELSKGMAQMIQLIITIIHDPDLIILDEPFSGLDPVNTSLLKKIIMELRSKGKAIILCTHQMNEVEELCDRILMINKGSVVLYGNLKEIRSEYKGHSVYVDLEDELSELKGVLERKDNKSYTELVLDNHTKPQDILDQLIAGGKTVNRFEVGMPSLNEIFIKLVTHNE